MSDWIRIYWLLSDPYAVLRPHEAWGPHLWSIYLYPIRHNQKSALSCPLHVVCAGEKQVFLPRWRDWNNIVSFIMKGLMELDMLDIALLLMSVCGLWSVSAWIGSVQNVAECQGAAADCQCHTVSSTTCRFLTGLIYSLCDGLGHIGNVCAFINTLGLCLFLSWS